MDQLRVGVIGTGFGRQSVRAFQAHPRATVTALAGASAPRTANVAGELGIRHAFADYRGLLAQAPVDAAVVVTPPHLHRPVAEAAFAAGKHVLCAKPMAESLEAARAMRDAAVASGLVHGMDQSFRTVPTSRYLQDLLEEGAVGRPLSVVDQVQLDVWGYYTYGGGSPSKGAWFTSPAGGGFLLATAQHIWDRLLWLFGPARAVSGSAYVAVPEVVLADGSRVRMRAPDATHAHIEFATGVVAVTQLTPARWGQHRNRLEIIGDEGALLLDGPAGSPVLQHAHRPSTEYATVPIPDRFIDGRVPPGVNAGLFATADRFVRAVLDGEPMSPTFEDGLRTQELMAAVMRSHETGQRQHLSAAPTDTPLRSTATGPG
jgi:predicted dehydrogenase